jgi:hypothetical protein
LKNGGKGRFGRTPVANSIQQSETDFDVALLGFEAGPFRGNRMGFEKIETSVVIAVKCEDCGHRMRAAAGTDVLDPFRDFRATVGPEAQTKKDAPTAVSTLLTGRDLLWFSRTT